MLPQLLDPRPYFADLPDPRRETRNKLHPLQVNRPGFPGDSNL